MAVNPTTYALLTRNAADVPEGRLTPGIDCQEVHPPMHESDDASRAMR